MCENCRYCAGFDMYGEPVCCKKMTNKEENTMKCSIYEPGWIYSKKDLVDMIIDEAKAIYQMERVIEFCDEEDKRTGETDDCREIARRAAKSEIAVYQAKIDEIRPFLE